MRLGVKVHHFFFSAEQTSFQDVTIPDRNIPPIDRLVLFNTFEIFKVEWSSIPPDTNRCINNPLFKKPVYTFGRACGYQTPASARRHRQSASRQFEISDQRVGYSRRVRVKVLQRDEQITDVVLGIKQQNLGCF